MARHSAARFDTGRQLAALATLLLKHTRNPNPLERQIRQELANATGYISKGDITELSRRHIFAAARVARALADMDKGKHADSLAMFGEAMAEYATGQSGDYIPALDKARDAVKLAMA